MNFTRIIGGNKHDFLIAPFIALIVLAILANCERIGHHRISTDQYVEYRTRHLLIREAFSKDSKKQDALEVRLLKELDIDTTQVKAFLIYYEKHPEEWIEIEKKIETKLTALKEREE